jgi:hypothetical protein
MVNPYIDVNGIKEWYLNGLLHRTDGPAREWANGGKQWFLNDELHRTDGPACEWDDGDTEWYLDDNNYTFDEWLEINSDLTHEEKVMMKLTHG